MNIYIFHSLFNEICSLDRLNIFRIKEIYIFSFKIYLNIHINFFFTNQPIDLTYQKSRHVAPSLKSCVLILIFFVQKKKLYKNKNIKLLIKQRVIVHHTSHSLALKKRTFIGHNTKQTIFHHRNQTEPRQQKKKNRQPGRHVLGSFYTGKKFTFSNYML